MRVREDKSFPNGLTTAKSEHVVVIVGLLCGSQNGQVSSLRVCFPQSLFMVTESSFMVGWTGHLCSSCSCTKCSCRG